MYNVGDEVVYPMHGAGRIVAIEEREVMEEKQSYYILEEFCQLSSLGLT